MATFNSTPNILNSAKSTEDLQSTATFFVPSPSPLLGLHSSFAATASAIENRSYIGIQKNLPNVTHHVNSSSTYTLMEIKREPCQVSEVTTSNGLQSSNQHNSKSTSSTMTAMVKIESTSPKVSGMGMDKVSQMSQINSVPVGIALARKRTQETPQHTTALPPTRDMNYFGIRVADIGGVSTAGCGSIYFAGSDLISAASNDDINTGINNVNRSASTFWQYPSTFPIESVISMSPVGLQYSRDVNRGQLVLLPTTGAMDSFQQAAFLWPSYMQQNSAGTLQSPSNFIFPSMSTQPNGQSPAFTAPLHLLASNYLTSTATSATSTLCQHSQTNGNRFISASSDTKRIEQSSKQNIMKIEDGSSEHNILSNIIAHNARIDNSKFENESNYLELQANSNLVRSMPILPHEDTHIILHNTPSPSELVNMPFSSNFIQSPDTITLTPEQMTQDTVCEMYKNSVLRVSSFPKAPETQDVNIQTDTPVCSEDENSSLEVSTAETMSCNIQISARNKSVSNLTPTQCHNNYGGCTSLLKENFGESLQLHPISNDYSKENTPFAAVETAPFQSDFLSNKSVNKNECFNSDNLIVLPSVDRGESSSCKVINTPLLEMSGLELLSNISTGSFANHNSLKTLCVKQEPCEIVENACANEILNNYETYAVNRNHLNTQYSYPTDESEMPNTINLSAQSIKPSLGGLNLLCALAEQRIQEEVASNNNVIEKNSEAKRRKHKHSKTKSGKKSRYYKKNKKEDDEERKDYIKVTRMKSNSDNVHANLKSVFKKVDSNYKKLNKWPNPEDFFKAMESDMRIRLADITRQYRKKKRKLNEISKIKKRKKTSSSEYKFANISYKNPNFICFLDKFQSTSSNFPPVEASKNQHITLHNKHHSECTPEASEDCEEKTFIDSKLNLSTPSRNSILVENLHSKENKDKKKQRHGSRVSKNGVANKSLASECQQQVTETKSNSKLATEFNKELVLSNEHLYRKETRVLTDMGGLFYAGILKPLQPPDVYAITLDGERGNKSHIMSREEIFKDTILEVAPRSIENVPTGTRLCAYWSQQYRCLYPGKAIESETSDIGSDFVSVEFDDGDSGRIHLQNIRFLLSDYPIVEYNENPFNTIGKNKRSVNMKSKSSDTMGNESARGEVRLPFIQESNRDSYAPKNDKKEIPYEDQSSTFNTGECLHKHKKHKKKKKHKKHHRKTSVKISAAVIEKDRREDSKTSLQGEQPANLNFNEVKNDEQIDNYYESATPIRRVAKKKVSTLLKKKIKSNAIELYGNDSTSNVVSEVSDKAKLNERVDCRSGKGSKIAAFLPERQLWGWLGQAYRKAGVKGRARKQFYKTITRGKETITVGECAVFLSTGRPDRPYIGRIESMWETTSSNKVVRVRWFYHPEETTGCPILKYPGGLFDSPHEDENDVQTISHRCEVIEFSVYIEKFGADTRQYQSIYDNNDTYYLSGYYNPRLQVLKLQPDIPVEEKSSV